MTWFKVDDSFYDHPKIFDAPDCALALWIRAGCWSARSLKDGFVPANLPARLCDDPDTAVRALVDRGLWKKVRGGYQFHDWHEYQPSAADVKELRAKRVEAGRRGGLAKATASKTSGQEELTKGSSNLGARKGGVDNHTGDPGNIDPEVQGSSNPLAKPLASASGFGKQNAAPSRPGPSYTNGSVDRPLPPVVGGQADDDQSLDMINDRIEGRIIELLAELTGRTVDRVHASTVRRQLLDDRPVTNPLGYVASCIRGEPKRYLPTNGAPWESPVPKLPPKDPDAYDHGAAEARKLLAEKLRKGAQ